MKNNLLSLSLRLVFTIIFCCSFGRSFCGYNDQACSNRLATKFRYELMYTEDGTWSLCAVGTACDCGMLRMNGEWGVSGDVGAFTSWGLLSVGAGNGDVLRMDILVYMLDEWYRKLYIYALGDANNDDVAARAYILQTNYGERRMVCCVYTTQVPIFQRRTPQSSYTV